MGYVGGVLREWKLTRTARERPNTAECWQLIAGSCACGATFPWLLGHSLFTTRFPSRSFAAAQKLESYAASGRAVESFSPRSLAKPRLLGSRARSLGFPLADSWRMARFD